MRRLPLLAFAVAAMLALSGCEKLCSQGAVTWCPRSVDDDLNDPPVLKEVAAGFRITSRLVRGRPDDPLIVAGAALVDGETTFTADARDPDGDQMLYEWDLDGDGEFEVDRSDPRDRTGRNTIEVRRFYRRAGATRMTLRVSDFPGLEGSGERREGEGFGAPGEVLLTREFPIIDPDANNPPRAAFTVSSTSVAVGEPITFDAGTSSDPDPWDDPDRFEGALRYKWDFGDIVGGDDEGRRTVHRYAVPGERTVTLTIRDFTGATAVATATVTVLPFAGPNSPPEARFTVRPDPPVADEPMTFDARSSRDAEGPITRYDWSFDGGRFIASERPRFEPSLTFLRPGAHSVTLRVHDRQGASATAERTVVVIPENNPPTASFTIIPNPAASEQTVRFDASASSDPDGHARRRRARPRPPAGVHRPEAIAASQLPRTPAHAAALQPGSGGQMTEHTRTGGTIRWHAY
jgi:PKD repeat protein